jgi:diguanylate cyclase (GGDEF)-like protein
MANALKQVTYITKKQLSKYDIVLPSEYSKLFEENAKQVGLDIDKEDIVLSNLQYDENKVNSIVKKTNKHLTQLNNSAKEAQTAIINKDEKTLHNIGENISNMKEQIEFLQSELFTDTLTKTKNRRWFNDFHLKDNKFIDNGCLVFIDLNDFKYINDTYGHVLGDQVLKYLANFLKTSLPFDFVDIARYAGDEFMVIFNKSYSDTKSLEKDMNNIQKALSKKTLRSKYFENIKFNFSYGLALFSKDDEFDKILESADAKMYINKKKMKGL